MFTFYTKPFKIPFVDLPVFILRKLTHTKVSNPQEPQSLHLAPRKSCLLNRINV